MFISAVAAGALSPAAIMQIPLIGDGPRKPPAVTIPRAREKGGDAASPDASPALRIVRRDGAVERRQVSREPPATSEFSFILADGLSRLAAPGTAVLVMSDGQRFTGGLDVEGGVVKWISPWVAPRTIDLDRIRALVLPGGSETMAQDEDIVELRNGDRVTGAIVSMLPDRVVLERAGSPATERVEVEMKDVSSISLVSSDHEWTGIRTWLTDGTVMDASDASWIGSGNLQFPSMPGARLPVATVPRRMVAAVQSSRDAATPLAQMEPEVGIPNGIPPDRARVALPPPKPRDGTWALDAPPIEIEGPVALRYSGLNRPSRLIMTASRPLAARSAGSPDLVIRSAGREVLRERLQADRASLEIRAELAAGPFEIELSSADGSIAGCFVVLEQALVLPTQPATDGR